MNGMENEKLRINMLSSSEKVAGQGVSGAYRELVRLLHRDAKDQLIYLLSKRNALGEKLAMYIFCLIHLREV